MRRVRIARQVGRAQRERQEERPRTICIDERFRPCAEALLQLREIDVLAGEFDARRFGFVERERKDIMTVGQAKEQVDAMLRRRPGFTGSSASLRIPAEPLQSATSEGEGHARSCFVHGSDGSAKMSSAPGASWQTRPGASLSRLPSFSALRTARSQKGNCSTTLYYIAPRHDRWGAKCRDARFQFGRASARGAGRMRTDRADQERADELLRQLPATPPKPRKPVAPACKSACRRTAAQVAHGR